MTLRLFGYACLAVITGAIVATALVLAFFISDRKLPVEVQTEVLTPVVRPGGRLILRQRINYLRDCAAHVDRAVYDDHTHRAILSDIDYERPLRGLGAFTVTFAVDIPADFDPGDAQYRANPVYFCNFVHRYYWPITRDDTVVKFRIEAPTR